MACINNHQPSNNYIDGRLVQLGCQHKYCVNCLKIGIFKGQNDEEIIRTYNNNKGCSIYKCLMEECYYLLTIKDFIEILGFSKLQQFAQAIQQKRTRGDKVIQQEQCLLCKCYKKPYRNLVQICNSNHHILCINCITSFLEYKLDLDDIREYNDDIQLICPFNCFNKININSIKNNLIIQEQLEFSRIQRQSTNETTMQFSVMNDFGQTHFLQQPGQNQPYIGHQNQNNQQQNLVNTNQNYQPNQIQQNNNNMHNDQSIDNNQNQYNQNQLSKECIICKQVDKNTMITLCHMNMHQKHLRDIENDKYSECKICKNKVQHQDLVDQYEKLFGEKLHQEIVNFDPEKKLCQFCNQIHKYVDENSKDRIYHYICQGQPKCTYCHQKYDGFDHKCSKEQRKKISNHQYLNLQYLPCHKCYQFTIKTKESQQNQKDISYKLQCSLCKALACQYCAVDFQQIENHGPSFHRPKCPQYKEFIFIPCSDCNPCQYNENLHTQRPKELQNFDLPVEELHNIQF